MKGSSLREARGAEEPLAPTFLFDDVENDDVDNDDVDEDENEDVDMNIDVQ